MLCVVTKPIMRRVVMLNVIMLSVIMLSVVAPYSVVNDGKVSLST
jgi:hypothetical protein